IVSYGPSATNKYITTYFRTTFNVATPPDSATIQLLADDGAVVYVNGQEVARDNMPTGTITNTTLASTGRSGGDENALRPFLVPVSVLQQGTNSIAVEVHQDRANSSDLSFDLDLSGQSTSGSEGSNQPPVASFTTAMSGLTGSFNAGGSSDPDGSITAYAWQFGDGSQGNGVTTTHTYAAAGSYTVTLTVTDTQGGTATQSQTVQASTSVTGDPVTTTVIAEPSSWRWRYDQTAPPSSWNQRGFNAGAWSLGAAPLGWGTAGPIATIIDTYEDTQDRPRAAYFRQTFDVSNPAQVVSLALSTVADDGVVVYVNGTEVGRSNMRDGTVTHTTYAPTAIGTSVANANPFRIDVPVGLLQPGTNVIAGQTHVNYRATPNLSFKLTAELTTLQ
ncbi:MAG: PKD domain-containing protein, partial [Microthrixaceae bacterium]